MKLFGLTGGVGMGKSTLGALLRDCKVPVIDTDAIARQVVEPGQPALQEIVREFGPRVIDAQGRLSRESLAQLVFSNPQARQQLENILHPRIRAAWLAEADLWREQGTPVGVVIIPLLFETRAETHFHATLCAGCSPSTQMQRLRERGWSEEEILRRIQAQWPIEKKIAHATFVIWTDSPIPVCMAQLKRIRPLWEL